MNKLKNKAVFITGRLSGIVKTCPVKALKKAANGLIVSLKADQADKILEDIEQESPNSVFVKLMYQYLNRSNLQLKA